MKVAVVAHTGKTLGGGLPELRQALADNGIHDVLWSEVAKSKFAPEQVRKAVAKGAELVIVWGGDGMVQRSIDVLHGSDVAVGIIPAGTANLLATNLAIPIDLRGALRVALHGVRRRYDVGRMNGECFAVMAGAGFDGVLMADVDGPAKEHLGRVAYVRSTVKAVKTKKVKADIRVDGAKWFQGLVSCVLIGNVGTVTGGLQVFDRARPDDGLLDLGVTSAEGFTQWARVLSRVVARAEIDHSPFVQTTQASKIDVRFDRKVPYEIDGGARKKIKQLKVRVRPNAIVICVPEAAMAIGADAVTADVSA